jgi:hypothetical protein
MDSVSDRLRGGSRVKGLTFVDTFTKENHVLIFGTSLTGDRVVRELEFATMMEGVPNAIQVDNGLEFICMAWISGPTPMAFSSTSAVLGSRPTMPTSNHSTGI